ncbi:MAG: PDZ domain-containing protein [Chloroflexota bacterium]
MAVTVAVVVLVLTLGYFIPGPTRSTMPQAPPQENARAADLGITYLPLTPGLSGYYDLGVDSGALITEIASGSLADKAGLKVGDVILSYNGAAVEKGNPLLGVIRGCPAGSNVVMEVCRGKISQTVSFVHAKG